MCESTLAFLIILKYENNFKYLTHALAPAHARATSGGTFTIFLPLLRCVERTFELSRAFEMTRSN